MVHCWDTDEFISYSKYFGLRKKKTIEWTTEISYSQAYQKLAYIANEHNDFEMALKYLKKGLILEPDHIELLCEKAYILGQQKRYQEAYELYSKAVNIRP